MKTKAAFLLLSLFLFSPRARAADCSHYWEVFSHVPMKEFLFPDTGARYWRYRFHFTPGMRIGFRLEGRFPHARYMNLITYDHTTFDPIDTLTDRQVRPARGSFNPFVHGAAKNVEPRRYSVVIVPQGTTATEEADNVLRMPEPAHGSKGMEIWYRIYLPDAARDSTGGVGLPRLTAFSLDDGKSVACPEPKGTFPPIHGALKNLPPTPANDALYTYRSGTGGLFSNRDNFYLTARLPSGKDDVAVLRFRAPTFPAAEETTVFNGETQVRYWSLCLSGISTLTAGCLEDRAATRDAAGFVTFVIGDGSLKELAERHRFSFLPRTPMLMPLLLYRNLVSRADFPGLMTKVPQWPPATGAKDPEALAAHRHIGDWAPVGRRCTVETFRRDVESGAATVCGVARPAGAIE